MRFFSKPPILQLEKGYLGKDLTNWSEIFRIYLSYYFLGDKLRVFLFLTYKQSYCQNYQSYSCLNFNLPFCIKFLKYSNHSHVYLLFCEILKNGMIWRDLCQDIFSQPQLGDKQHVATLIALLPIATNNSHFKCISLKSSFH